MKNDVYYFRIGIEKLEELKDAAHPNNIEVGYKRYGVLPTNIFKIPEVGKRFYIDCYFSTSIVTEIIDGHTFKTLNSIYRWSIIETFK